MLNRNCRSTRPKPRSVGNTMGVLVLVLSVGSIVIWQVGLGAPPLASGLATPQDKDSGERLIGFPLEGPTLLCIERVRGDRTSEYLAWLYAIVRQMGSNSRASVTVIVCPDHPTKAIEVIFCEKLKGDPDKLTATVGVRRAMPDLAQGLVRALAKCAEVAGNTRHNIVIITPLSATWDDPGKNQFNKSCRVCVKSTLFTPFVMAAHPNGSLMN